VANARARGWFLVPSSGSQRGRPLFVCWGISCWVGRDGGSVPVARPAADGSARRKIHNIYSAVDPSFTRVGRTAGLLLVSPRAPSPGSGWTLRDAPRRGGAGH